MSKRRHFTGAEKDQILKRHLLEHTPISALCEEFKIYPSQFHQWLKDFFENGQAAFENGRKGRAQTDAKDREIAALKAKLKNKTEVVAELAEAFTWLKTTLGET